MATKVGESEGVVCYCICNFPLPGLRARDLESHPTDTFLMHHFHLPLHAPQTITALNMMEWVQWFGRLHHAHRTLKAAAEIEAFEQSVEAACQQVQQTFSGARQGLQALREAFASELERAIAETSMHAMDQWEPEANSLSWMIWHCDVRNADSLKVFNMGLESIPLLRLWVESRVSSLSHCNLQIGPAQDELEGLRREVEALREENGSLRDKLQETTDAINVHEVQTTARPFEQKSLHKNTVLKTKSCSVYLCKAIQTESSTDIKTTKSTKVHRAQKKNERKSMVSLPIITQGDHYDASELQGAPKALQTREIKEGSNLIGLGGWIEAMGAHLGKFKDAQDIIAKALQEQRELDPTDVKVLETLNLQAALYFHCGQEEECIEICKKVLQNCNNCHPQVYLTALFFYANIVNDEDADAVAENDILSWVSKAPESNNSLCKALKMCVIGRVHLNHKGYVLAHMHLTDAQTILKESYPVSLFAAMNEFCLGRACTFPIKVAAQYYLNAERVFSAAFSKSIWRGVNLYWLGEMYLHLYNPKKVINAKKRANEIFMNYHRCNIYFPDTLSEIADWYESKRTSKLDEIYYREKAHAAYSEFYPITIRAMQNLTRLGTLYRKQKRLEDAKRCLHEAREILAAHHPSSIENGQNFLCLALLYAESNQDVEALQFAKKAKEILSTTSEVAREDLRAAKKLLTRLLITKKRKIEEAPNS